MYKCHKYATKTEYLKGGSCMRSGMAGCVPRYYSLCFKVVRKYSYVSVMYRLSYTPVSRQTASSIHSGRKDTACYCKVDIKRLQCGCMSWGRKEERDKNGGWRR